MPQMIYINLPVKDLGKSKQFFSSLGFRFKEEFGSDSAGCMVVSDTIYVMLLVEQYFATFTSKPIADAHVTTETLLCLSCSSRNRVDELVKLAVTVGGSSPRAPVEDSYGYGHGFADLDGHMWELMFMKSQSGSAL